MEDIMQTEIEKRIEQLKNSIVYTPVSMEEIHNVGENLEYYRKVGDTSGIQLTLIQLQQGKEYLRLIARL